MSKKKDPEAIERFERQADLVPRDSIKDIKCTVIGVGAIGRQVALQLAAIGAPEIQLIDNDAVDHTNRTTQGYKLGDVGVPKVIATRADMLAVDDTLHIEPIEEKYLPKHSPGKAVFSCVDDILARQDIFNSLQHGEDTFWADGRMLGETMRILTVVAGNDGLEYYPRTIFPPEQAEVGRCTARSTIYTANIAAGLMVSAFTRWLRGIPPLRDVIFSLLSEEFNPYDEPETSTPLTTSSPVLAGVG